MRSFLAGVAQLVEQLICNQWVVGSSPITGSRHIKASQASASKAFFIFRDAENIHDTYLKITTADFSSRCPADTLLPNKH